MAFPGLGGSDPTPTPRHAHGHLVPSTDEAAQADSTSPSRAAAAELRAECRYQRLDRAGRGSSGLVRVKRPCWEPQTQKG